ncbi:MAG: hypothetical protein QHJ81_10595 [Anaerolineae bacterium]|nr:hypothetical protein [Anaerolineae bacterium]
MEIGEEKMPDTATTLTIQEPVVVLPVREFQELLQRLEGVRRWESRKLILLYSLHQPRLRLKEPLAVLLERDNGQVIAQSFDLDLFGYGDTESEALEDLRQTVADLYFELKESAGGLGTLPEKVWGYLKDIVSEV